MGKMTRGRFKSCVGDTPEQIRMCLNCVYSECINCLDEDHIDNTNIKVDFDAVKKLKMDRVRKNKKLSKNEKTLLSLYPLHKTDVELSKMTGFSTSQIFRMRKNLGLPTMKWTSLDVKLRLAEIWMN